MTRSARYAVAGVTAAFLCLPPTAPAGEAAAQTEEAAEAPSGEKVFQRKNCQQCHAVVAAEIERGEVSERMRGPDLSDIGSRMTDDELRHYLEKGDPVRGEQHWKGFWGDEEDFEALVVWLSSLRTESDEGTDDSGGASPDS